MELSNAIQQKGKLDKITASNQKQNEQVKRKSKLLSAREFFIAITSLEEDLGPFF